MTCWPTQPDTVNETLRLPLRAVVASSSAMRSSRSAQQLPPRSAANALVLLVADMPPASRPAATRAPSLYFIIPSSPVFITSSGARATWRLAVDRTRRDTCQVTTPLDGDALRFAPSQQLRFANSPRRVRGCCSLATRGNRRICLFSRKLRRVLNIDQINMHL